MPFFDMFDKVPYKFNGGTETAMVTDMFRYINVADFVEDSHTTYRDYTINEGERPDLISHKLYGTPDYYWTIYMVNSNLIDPDGWPLSYVEFEKFLSVAYEGYVLDAVPYRNQDGSYTNCLAGMFIDGEPVRGATSGATGIISRRIPEYNQVVIRDVVGDFLDNENVIGQKNGESFGTRRAFKYPEAPYAYLDSDGNKASNALFINGGVPNEELTVYTYRDYEDELNTQKQKIRVIHPDIVDDFVLQFKKKIKGVY